MDDPWTSTVDGNSITTTESNELPLHFDNNFCPSADHSKDIILVLNSSQSSFQPLPDSSTYLANLEKKLGKLRKKSSASDSGAEKRDLLLSLKGAREGHIDRLLNSQLSQSQGLGEEEHFDSPVEDSLSGTVIRHIAPHLQAVTTGELVHLVKADQLQESTAEEDTTEITNNQSE